jgi:1,2-phenylacetyl-CoA epoxidase catalytic subunit
MPPNIEKQNITKSTIVRDEVGNTSEDIRLAEELAGEANTNSNTIVNS